MKPARLPGAQRTLDIRASYSNTEVFFNEVYLLPTFIIGAVYLENLDDLVVVSIAVRPLFRTYPGTVTFTTRRKQSRSELFPALTRLSRGGNGTKMNCSRGKDAADAESFCMP